MFIVSVASLLLVSWTTSMPPPAPEDLSASADLSAPEDHTQPSPPSTPQQHNHTVLPPIPGYQSNGKTIVSPPQFYYHRNVSQLQSSTKSRAPKFIAPELNTDFLTSFFKLMEPNQNDSGSFTMAANTLEKFNNMLHPNEVPKPEIESRSDPGHLLSKIGALALSLFTFVLRKKMIIFAIVLTIAVAVLWIAVGTASIFRQGKDADGDSDESLDSIRKDTLQLMLSQEWGPGFVASVQELWDRLVNFITGSSDAEVTSEETDGVAQDRNDENVSDTISSEETATIQESETTKSPESETIPEITLVESNSSSSTATSQGTPTSSTPPSPPSTLTPSSRSTISTSSDVSTTVEISTAQPELLMTSDDTASTPVSPPAPTTMSASPSSPTTPVSTTLVMSTKSTP